MADKVQFILEDVLNQAIFLTKKGIFSQGQLHQQMINRQRFENQLIKSTHRVTDYLKAIQYEYQIERIRRYRISRDSEFKIEPKYKRSDTKDFTIVKRIIRLWDRAMHKYKYRIDLWKQYLSFAYVIKSKKIFYKALSNAIRFNPFNIQMWLSGVYYELQVNKNPWKGRRIFHKSLKINKKNEQFWIQYLKYELIFAQLILKREQLLRNKDDKNDLRIKLNDIIVQQQQQLQIGQQQQTNFVRLINLVIKMGIQNVQKKQQYLDKVIEILLQNGSRQILKNTVKELRQNLEQGLKNGEIINKDKKWINNKLIKLNKQKYIQDIINNNNGQYSQKIQIIKNIKDIQEKQNRLFKLKVNQMIPVEIYQYYQQWVHVFIEKNIIIQSVLQKIILQYLFKPKQLTFFIQKILKINQKIIWRKFINKKIKIPTQILIYYLTNQKYLNISTFQIQTQLKKITHQDYLNLQFLKALIQYHKNTGHIAENIRIYKQIQILYPKNTQIKALVHKLLNQ